MTKERLEHVFELSASVLIAMIAIIIFGWPTGNVAVVSFVAWMFTFIHLNRKMELVLKELRDAKQMSKVRIDDVLKREEVSMVREA